MALSLLKKFNFLWLFFFCTITFGQQQVSIFIEKGLIGEIGNNAQSLVNPSRTFTDLELIGAMFYQEIGSGDPDAPFTAQGNDVPGRIRFFKNDNTSIDIEALAVWSDNDPYGFGIILPETVLNSRSFVVTLTSSNGDLGLYDGLVKQTNSSSGSSNIFLYFDSQEYTLDGVNNNSETSGNASNPAADINTYYKNAVLNDVTNPTINDQSFSYFENSTVSDTLASVIAIDNVGVTLFSITSGDENNFFTINNSGDITLTEVGVNSLANDFETGTNTFTLEISIEDSNSNTATGTITLSLLNQKEYIINNFDEKPVSETGTTNTFSIVLDTQPTDDVIFDITSSDEDEAIVTGTVTFTALNWSDAQTVTITGVDDALIDGTQTSTITISIASSNDLEYASLSSQTLNIDTTDDDSAGFSLTSTDNKIVSETGTTTDTFTIVLNKAPTDDVVFEITSSDTTEAIVTGTVTFTAGNWSTAQTVTITSVDDSLIDGTQTSTITISVSSSLDGQYAALASQTVSVDTLDDDVAAGFTLADTGGKTVSETGTTDTFTIVLDALPSSNVVLKITSSDEGEALVTSTITFTIGNWNIPQLVTITGIDDALIDGNQRSTITISVDDLLSDNNFDPLNDQTLEVIILDDDVNEPDEIDTDNDGIPDVDDPDDDDDGTPDSSDDFPLDPSEDTDTDGDGIGDNSDSDADNDGINDNEDNCPLTPNPDQLDTDNDGKGDVCDTDKDGSGYQDEYEEQCGDSFIPIDTDGDSIPDCADEDDDNDGYKDEDDDFPLDENEWLDTDNDGLGNNADPDDDNDGQSDLYEIECGSDPLNNNSIAEDIDQDGIPDCLDDDKDGDGVKNEEDVFSEDPKEWEDTDSDGIGDNEDPDDDNDGFSDEAELACDADTKNAQDFPDDTDEDLTPDCIDDDIDNDGCLNEIDLYPFDPLQCLDSDGDGISDYFDSDDDNDGIWDYQDDFPLDPDKSKDTDGDGVDDLLDSDSNGDGLPDGELFPAQVFSPNGDGIGDGWNVVNTDFFPNCEVWIFTRSGELVFRKRGYQNDWKGTLNGSDLPEGSYYYNIDKEGDGSIEYKGWLYLTR